MYGSETLTKIRDSCRCRGGLSNWKAHCGNHYINNGLRVWKNKTTEAGMNHGQIFLYQTSKLPEQKSLQYDKDGLTGGIQKSSPDARYDTHYIAGLLAETEMQIKRMKWNLINSMKLILTKLLMTKLKMEEVKRIVQSNLWSKYRQHDLCTGIMEPQEACNDAVEISVSAVSKSAYERQLSLVENLI